MTEKKKKTISPYQNGPGALEARKKALRPSFRDLEARAAKLAEEQSSQHEGAYDMVEDDIPEGVNMGGGNSSPFAPDNVKTQLVKKAAEQKTKSKDFDPLDPFDDNTKVAHPDEVNMVRAESPLHGNLQPAVTATPCERCSFYDMNEEVRITLDNGEFMVNAIDIRDSEFSITLMVSLDSKFVFTPKPGTELTLGYRDHKDAKYAAVKVFYPGAKTSYEELGILLLTFIKADSDE